MSDVPFAVREFSKTPYIASEMNEWFALLANDTAHEYDIRQILVVETTLLVFYEVTPVASVEEPENERRRERD